MNSLMCYIQPLKEGKHQGGMAPKPYTGESRPAAPPPPPQAANVSSEASEPLNKREMQDVVQAYAARTLPKVELMRPTIHVTLVVRKVVAAEYSHAATIARQMLIEDQRTAELLNGMGLYGSTDFHNACRVAKEADGIYTVTLP